MPCADLSSAAQAVEGLGFTVGRRNRHPWGTENHIIQVPGAFLELVALAPDFVRLDAADDAFPFAGFLAGQGAAAEPSGMLVLRSDDASADAARFSREGIGSGRTLHFARSGQAPDGTTRPVAFTLAFAEAPTAPELGFFVCQQHHPENFWNPAMQRHSNGVTGIAEVVLAASDPLALTAFLAVFADHRETSVDTIVDLSGGTRLRVEGATAARPPGLAAIRFADGAPSAGVHHLGGLTLDLGGVTVR